MANAVKLLDVKDGIQWFEVTMSDGRVETDCECANCGSSVMWVDCGQCDEGYLGSDCIDDLCHGGECIHGDSGQIRCDFCRGEGGWWRCVSEPDWCKAHPMAVPVSGAGSEQGAE